MRGKFERKKSFRRKVVRRYLRLSMLTAPLAGEQRFLIRVAFVFLLAPLILLFPTRHFLMTLYYFGSSAHRGSVIVDRLSAQSSKRHFKVWTGFWLDFFFFVEQLFLFRGQYDLAMRVVELQWGFIPKSKPDFLWDLVSVGHSLSKFDEVREAIVILKPEYKGLGRLEYMDKLFSEGSALPSLEPGEKVARVLDRKRAVLVGPGEIDAAVFLARDANFSTLAQVISKSESSFYRPTQVQDQTFNEVAAYINGEYSRAVDWRSKSLEDYGIDCLVFKSSGVPPLSGSYRFAALPEPFFQRGTPHLGSVAAFDLWSVGASAVFVTGMDFHLGQKVYSDAYGIEFTEREARAGAFRRSSSFHNTFENWGFLALMVWAGYLDGDETFMRIMSLSATAFAEALEEAYGR